MCRKLGWIACYIIKTSRGKNSFVYAPEMLMFNTFFVLIVCVSLCVVCLCVCLCAFGMWATFVKKFFDSSALVPPKSVNCWPTFVIPFRTHAPTSAHSYCCTLEHKKKNLIKMRGWHCCGKKRGKKKGGLTRASKNRKSLIKYFGFFAYFPWPVLVSDFLPIAAWI